MTSRGLLRWSLLWAFLLPLSALRVPGIGNVADVVLFIAFPGTLLWAVFCAGPATGRIWLRLGAALSLAALAGVACSINAVSVQESALGVLKFAMGLIAVVMLLVSSTVAERGGPRIAWAYVSGCAALAASTWVTSGPGERAVGLGGHPVEVGDLVAAGACLAVFLPARTRFGRCLRWPIVVLLLSAFVAAVTLTGIIAFAAGLTYALIRRRQMSVQGAATLVAGGLALRWALTSWAPAALLVEKLQRSTNADTPDNANSVEARNSTLIYGWHRIQQHPILGNGLDTSGSLAVGNLAPHNILVFAWQVGGVLVLAVVVALLFTSLRAIWSTTKLAGHGPELEAALRASSVAAWVGALSGPSLYQRTWIFPVLFTIILSRQIFIDSMDGRNQTLEMLPALPNPSLPHISTTVSAVASS